MRELAYERVVIGKTAHGDRVKSESPKALASFLLRIDMIWGRADGPLHAGIPVDDECESILVYQCAQPRKRVVFEFMQNVERKDAICDAGSSGYFVRFSHRQ